jgi:hypothetical protein
MEVKPDGSGERAYLALASPLNAPSSGCFTWIDRWPRYKSSPLPPVASCPFPSPILDQNDRHLERADTMDPQRVP